MNKEELVQIWKFIDNFEGELVIKLDGVYHNSKLVAKVKNRKTLILV